MKKPLIIFEMANNHMGNAEFGRHIIYEFAKLSIPFEDTFQFAFKFQLRDLNTFIHPNYKNRMDLKYVKRFTETSLTPIEFKFLKQCAIDNEFLTICTAFDENSVDVIREMNFHYIKIASCSLTDWPLINKIAELNIPIIASVAGSSLEDIDRVVSFFSHRGKSLSLMHCVGEYPTDPKNHQINQIDVLKKRYQGLKIGWSTHEAPTDTLSVKLAIARGAEIFEKHVGVASDKYPLNNYSVNPAQMTMWLQSAQEAMERCGISDERSVPSEKEMADLRQFKRGVFAATDIKVGDIINRKNVFYAWPNIENQVVANDMSKYVHFISKNSIKNGEPITTINTDKIDRRKKVWDAVIKVKELLKKSEIKIPGSVQLELSHHYGVDKFFETGITMITVVNRGYCKKLIIVLPGQFHPEQYHKIKEETFIILYGKVKANIDGTEYILKEGDIHTIHPLQKHSFTSEEGCIIEELSSTHIIEDSFYTDDVITNNLERKTIVNYWL